MLCASGMQVMNHLYASCLITKSSEGTAAILKTQCISVNYTLWDSRDNLIGQSTLSQVYTAN